jgi:hypothetical protein
VFVIKLQFFINKPLFLVVALHLLNREMTLREKQQNFVHTIKTNTKEHDDVFVRRVQNKRIICFHCFSSLLMSRRMRVFVLFWRFHGAEITRVCFCLFSNRKSCGFSSLILPWPFSGRKTPHRVCPVTMFLFVVRQNKRITCRDRFSSLLNIPAYVCILLFRRFPGAEIRCLFIFLTKIFSYKRVFYF